MRKRTEVDQKAYCGRKNIDKFTNAENGSAVKPEYGGLERHLFQIPDQMGCSLLLDFSGLSNRET